MTLIYDDYLQASNGTGEAVRSNVVVERPIGSTEINVDTVLNWPNKFIATSGVLDAVTGTFSPSTITVFFGHINGTYLTIDEFAPGYSDRGNTANEIIVLKPTTPWSDKIAIAVTNAVHKADILAATTYDASIKAYVDAAITAAKTAMRIAIGGLYISTSSANPATVLGYGTWVAEAVGRTLMGAGNNGDGFVRTGGDTFGVAEVLLTAAQSGVPNHTHTIVQIPAGNVWAAPTYGLNYTYTAGSYYSAQTGGLTPIDAAQAHTNLPPTKVYYIWARTA
jgi:hypothetical protein